MEANEALDVVHIKQENSPDSRRRSLNFPCNETQVGGNIFIDLEDETPAGQHNNFNLGLLVEDQDDDPDSLFVPDHGSRPKTTISSSSIIPADGSFADEPHTSKASATQGDQAMCNDIPHSVEEEHDSDSSHASPVPGHPDRVEDQGDDSEYNSDRDEDDDESDPSSEDGDLSMNDNEYSDDKSGSDDDHNAHTAVDVEPVPERPAPAAQKPRRAAVKSVAEYAARLSRERQDDFRKYVKRNMHKIDQVSGFIEPPPAPPKPRAKKPKKGDSGKPGGASAVDLVSIPSSTEDGKLVFVTKRDRGREIAKCTNSIGNNRHGDNQKKDITEGSKVFGHSKVQCFEGRNAQGTERFYLLKGMNSKLKEYQLPVVAWCALQEHSDIGPQSGIIADEPGFGKTIEILAAMFGNPPSKAQRKAGKGATLVVVHNATMARQWRSEIQKHLNREYYEKSFIFTRKNSWEYTLKDLSEKWIVITTYSEALMSFGATEPCYDLDNDGGHLPHAMNFKGKLHNIEFYRLVLDEVHNIKNHEGSNNVEELYAYIKLIGGMEVDTFLKFKEFYMNSAYGLNMVDVLMTNCTYRRTDEDLFLGNRMMKLPQKHTADQNITLTAVERVIQLWLDDIFGNDETKVAEEACTGSMRYRQLLSHPYALESFLRGDGETGITVEELQDLYDSVRAVEQSAVLPTVDQIGTWSQRQVSDDSNLRNLGEPKKLTPFGASDFGVKCFAFAPLIKLAITDHKIREDVCTMCDNYISDPELAEKCGHHFCGGCIKNWLKTPNRTNKCPSCGTETELVEVTTLVSLEEKFNKIEQAREERQKANKKKKKQTSRARGNRRGGRTFAPDREPEPEPTRERRLGEDAKGVCPILGPHEGAFMKIAFMQNNGIPAAGILFFGGEGNIHTRNASFIQTLWITGIMLQVEGIDFVYTYGKMNKERKSEAKTAFETDSNVKVLVATMSTCGEGLNLTCANRVIVVDAWWNNAREKQSFGRVVRTGQTKETYCVRIKALNSIDDKIEGIQVNKSRVVDFVVQDDKHDPFTLSELGVLNLLNPEKYLKLCIETATEIRGVAHAALGLDDDTDLLTEDSDGGKADAPVARKRVATTAPSKTKRRRQDSQVENIQEEIDIEMISDDDGVCCG
ncbi:hypothetical protein ACHAQH_009494 [Verticillium albo-atrum]